MIELTPEIIEKHLPAQRWFGAKDRSLLGVQIRAAEQLRDTWPLLARVVVDVDVGDEQLHAYQLLVGARPLDDDFEFLHGSDYAVLGEIETPSGAALAYDATLDHELGLELLRLIAPDEEVTLVRPMGGEQSNTSLVYDDRLVLKVFRQLGEGPNLDVEVTVKLAEVGFAHVAEPVTVWRAGGDDLAVVQRYLVGGTDGWSLALTSLRDLLAMHDTQQLPIIRPGEPPPELDPAEAGGDFAAEAERLGAVTAELHAAFATAFGRDRGDPAVWAGAMEAQLSRTLNPDLDERAVSAAIERLRSVRQPGPSIRVHGDLHLGQVLRTDAGWFVLDFEGEPARPLVERRETSSPLRDVAGMLRSFHYAAQVALRERNDEAEIAELAPLADAWEQRNRDAFLAGYLPPAVEAGLVAEDATSWLTVLAAFELDKAVYEIAYEMAHRPEWVGIPLSAIRRILEASA